MFDTLPEAWTRTTLKDAAAELFKDGDWVESKDQDPNGEVRLIQLADMGDGSFLNKSARFLTAQKARELRCTILQPGDLLIARMADPIARCCLFPGLDQPAATVVDISIVRPGPHVDREFLSYAVSSPAFRNEALGAASGTTRSRISRSNLGQIEIPVPPLVEQRRIAEVLRSVDEAISATRNIIEHQGELWQNLAEALIWEDGTESLRPLGIALVGSDYGVNVPLNTDGLGKPVLRMGNIQDGQIDLADVKWGEITDKEAQALKLNEGDILFNRTNSRDLVGKVALVREATDCLYASYIVRLVIDRTIAEPYYVFAVMHSDRAQSALKSIATPGVSQSNINPTNLKKQMVPLPPISRQKIVAEQLNAVEFSRLCAKRELKTILSIKQNVASSLLSGRIRVPA